MELGGIMQAFHKHRKKLFQTMIRTDGAKVFKKIGRKDAMLGDDSQSQVAW